MYGNLSGLHMHTLSNKLTSFPSSVVAAPSPPLLNIVLGRATLVCGRDLQDATTVARFRSILRLIIGSPVMGVVGPSNDQYQ